MQRLITAVLATIICLSTFGQSIKRRGNWQGSVSFSSQEIGGVVKSIEDKSPLTKAEIKVNDVLIEVNGQPIQYSENWTSAWYGMRGNEPTLLKVRRGTTVFTTSVQFTSVPMEEHTGLDTYYENVISKKGIAHRIIITKPKKKGKQPAMVFLGGLSCSSLELTPGRNHNWAKQIRMMVEDSDMVVMRIEKTGVGDSNGDCAESDFMTDLEGYRAAVRHLKKQDYVDTTKIIVYGSSMGSALAPAIANEFNLSGVISDGTFFKTWFEHMLEIERRILKMKGDDESTITKKMNQAYIPLYYGMLIQKKSYEEVIKEYPAIAEYNYHSPNHMYGRPLSYYHQLQDFDIAGNWERLKAPVRIVRGTNDWIMSEFDNHMIIKALEQAGHEDHELAIYPGLDHWNTIHESPNDSFNGKEGKWEEKVPEMIIKWAKEMVK